MKSLYPMIPILPAILLTLGSGCALLGLKDGSDPDEDPIATVALRLRDPANGGSSTSTDGAFETELPARPTEHLLLGMNMNDVIAVWGDPNDIETAGDSREGNQRWTYLYGLSSRWSMGSKRVVYFENGRVAGWKAGE